MHGSRKPTPEEKEVSKIYREKRKKACVGLRLMSRMTGYNHHYLSHVESGQDPSTISFVEEYDRVLSYIDAGCQKNKRKRKFIKKSS